MTYPKTWRPTHIIIDRTAGTAAVMLDDGVAYTFLEWRENARADYDMVDGAWYRCGEAFNGEVLEVPDELRDAIGDLVRVAAAYLDDYWAQVERGDDLRTENTELRRELDATALRAVQ